MRKYTDYATEYVRNLLNTLTDASTSNESYQKTMYSLGRDLAEKIVATLKPCNPDAEICIACTVEDADFLAKGLIDVIEEAKCFTAVRFACFWNERVDPFDVKEAHIAPILKKYREPFKSTLQYLIVVKSVISGGCVIKTNLTNLINESNPQKIMIVAPVILEGADKNLENEFSFSIASRFQFWFYAMDNSKRKDGNLDPGIGGSVYERLGFKNGQLEKNQYVPALVKKRRSDFVGQYATQTA